MINKTRYSGYNQFCIIAEPPAISSCEYTCGQSLLQYTSIHYTSKNSSFFLPTIECVHITRYTQTINYLDHSQTSPVQSVQKNAQELARKHGYRKRSGLDSSSGRTESRLRTRSRRMLVIVLVLHLVDMPSGRIAVVNKVGLPGLCGHAHFLPPLP